MALKKSELYSSLWSSCDELRGGMDASQYKDCVLVLRFIKYVSDKCAGQPYAPISIPKGASFADLVALKGKPDIGDRINKQILGPLAAANRLADMPDFNEATKLGSGQEMVDKLTNLIAIFENRAEGDDLLGDAYEYLMRHFATESGKSKRQFYTPAEVSRIIAQLLGIRQAKTSVATTVYDPTCGSGYVRALAAWWAACPALEAALFKPNATHARGGYVDLAVDKAAIKPTIHGHPQFVALRQGLQAHFATWRTKTAKKLKALQLEFVLVHELAHLLEPRHGEHFTDLMDALLPPWPQWRDRLNRLPLPQGRWTL